MSDIIKSLRGIFENQFNAPEQIEKLKKGLTKFQLPENLTNPLLDYMLERTYLEDITDRSEFLVSETKTAISWLVVRRLPIHPSELANYDLISKWQTALSAIHAWNSKMIFVLQRKGGETSINIGIYNQSGDTIEGLAKLKSALVNCMPGIDVETLASDGSYSQNALLEGTTNFIADLYAYKTCGAVTGIPSFRKDKDSKLLQTLDKLAFGIRDSSNQEVDFALEIVAEPISDGEISDVIGKYEKLGSDIHTDVLVHASESESINKGENKENTMNATLGFGEILNTAGKLLGPFIPITGTLSAGACATLLGTSTSISHTHGKSQGVTVSSSTSRDYLNKFAQYTEKMTDMHCERLRKGRNLGFWNVGTYILGYSNNDVETLLGILRSIYSGDETYLEPIRLHHLNSQQALNSIRQFTLIPLLHPSFSNKTPNIENEEWHILGKPYQYLSTPINTEELSLVTSLPRKDVPGLRFVRSAVRFANNPGEIDEHNSLSIGRIIDTGILQKTEYKIDINSLVRHSIIVGSTGCGKTTTCKTIINDVISKHIPVLIIEPAKDEYVRWAIKQNETLPENEKINIFMPGVRNLEVFGVKEGMRTIPQLKINPFQPAAIKGAPIDLLTHCEQVTALINASLPTSDILPIIIDEAFFSLMNNKYGLDFTSGECEQKQDFPKIEDVLPIANNLLKERGYSSEIANGLFAALETRFTYLTRGKRGEILNVFNSTSYDKIFNHTTVINVSRIASDKDRSLIMSMLMLALYEYRISAYTYDSNYRETAQKNKLLHLTVIEEAHNVLKKPAINSGGTGNPQQVVADLFSNMLSEIRSYGEGLMVVDQVPTRLIPDVIRNTNYKIVHRLASIEDTDVMSGALGLRPDQKDIIPLLTRGQAIITSDRDDAASWVNINKPKILL